MGKGSVQPLKKTRSVNLIVVCMAVVGVLWGVSGCGMLKTDKGQARVSKSGGNDSLTSASLEFSGLYIEASKEKILGNFSRAESMLREGIKVYPTHAPSYYQLADIFHIQGEYREAFFWIEQAVKLDPENVWYRALYADILLKLGRYREATAAYRWLNNHRPGYRLWFEALAFAQAGAGDPKGAAETYRGILEDFGYDEAIFLKMIGIYEELGQQKQVEQSLKWLIRKYPYDTRYLGALAGFYHHRGQSAKAYPLWQEILRIEPDNGEVRFDLANYYRSRGEDHKAYEELLEAFKSPNLSIDAKIVVMLSYYNLTGKYPALIPEAYQLLEVMVQRHPENPKGWSMYGDFLFRDKQFPAALEKMQKVVMLDSTRYLVWEQLLQSAWIMHDFEVLRTDGARAIRMFPEQASLYLMHGTGLLYGDRFTEALTAFQQGYYFAGLNDTLAASLLHGMARIYELMNEATKAAETYRKASLKDNLNSDRLAGHFRFAVTWGYKEQIEALNKTLQTAGEKRDPMLKICELWSILARGGGASEVAIPLSMLIAKYPDHYLLMEHATAIYTYCNLSDEARITWEQALKLTRGNLLNPLAK